MNTNPTYDCLLDRDGNPIAASFADNMHPNAKLYKYQWQIFHRGAPEGKAFFGTPKLSTYEAMALLEKLRKEGEGYLIYNGRLPRSGKDTPIDLTHERWSGCTPAPCFEDDVDPEWQGHK